MNTNKKAAPKTEAAKSQKQTQSSPNSTAAQRDRILTALRKGPLTTLQARSELDTLHPAARVTALRGDGSMAVFWKTGSNWGSVDTRDTLQPLTDPNGKVTGWRYGVTNTGEVEQYDANGKLLSVRERNGRTTTLTYNATAQLTQVTAPSGRSLTFAYDAQGRVSSITAPDGAITQYAYNANGMLTTVTWPDNTTRQYVYDDTRFPTALTGVIDEAGVRYATYAYDDQGRAITSELTAGADRYQFQYQANGQTTVLTPDGGSSVYSFLKQNGVLLPTGVSAPCPTCGNTALSTSYDSNNNATSKTGYDGSTTSYSYDALGRETQRIEGAGTANAKTTTTEWDPQQWLVTRVAAPNKIEAFSYDANGNLLSHTVTPTGDANGSQGFGALASGDAESTEWTYDSVGNVLTVTQRQGTSAVATWTYTYDAQGNLQTLTNPEGKTGTMTQYDAAGRVLAATDVNGVNISYTYNARGFLTRYIHGDEVSWFSYDLIGQRVRFDGPFGEVTKYVYDASHRLIDVLYTPGPDEEISSPEVAATKAVSEAQSSEGFLSRVWKLVVRAVSSLLSDAHAQPVPPAAQVALSGSIPIPYPMPPAPGPNLDPRSGGLSPKDHLIIWASKLVQQCGSLIKSATNTNAPEHRGRIQSQGAGYADAGTGDVESWSQATPLTVADGLAKLAALESRMTKKQWTARSQAVAKARAYMIKAAGNGGDYPPGPGTFQNDSVRIRRGDERVDIEIRKGIAFVP